MNTSDLPVTEFRIGESVPHAYRLARKSQGGWYALTLQGGYRWRAGETSGVEWREIPVVDIDAAGNEIKLGPLE